LERYPNARWIFHGHDHYPSQGRAWGLNISHLDRTATNVEGTAGLVVQVDAKEVRINRFDSGGILIPAVNEYDLDSLFTSRLHQENGHTTYRIGETSLDWTSLDPLRNNTSLVDGTDTVRPTCGRSMIQVERSIPNPQGEKTTPLYTWISTDIVDIKKGMKFI